MATDIKGPNGDFNSELSSAEIEKAALQADLKPSEPNVRSTASEYSI
jgi:hypothetical protein